MKAIFQLLEYPALSEPLLRKISNICQEGDIADILVRHGGIHALVSMMSSSSQVIQSLLLKTIILIASSCTLMCKILY